VQLVEDVVDLLVAAELPHVDVTDLFHGLATRERRHHDWVGRLLQDPGTAKLKEAHRAGQEGGGDQFNDQAGLA
jgi:rubrerythrin